MVYGMELELMFRGGEKEKEREGLRLSTCMCTAVGDYVNTTYM